MKKVRAALYARVSTKDQKEAMQNHEMKEFAARRFDPTIFADAGWSGAKESRPEFDRMMAEVRKGKFDVVIVYKFDRFARSLRQLVNSLAEFEALGVQFISIHDAVDTTTPQGRLSFHIIAAIAEFEREMLRERVRSSIAFRKSELKSKGYYISSTGRRRTTLGRPAANLDASYIRKRREQGATWSAIASEMNVSTDTCQRTLLKAAKA